MTERDALLLEYPVDDDELAVDVGSNRRNRSAKKTRHRKRDYRGDMSLQAMSMANSTDDDMVDISAHSQETQSTASEFTRHTGSSCFFNYRLSS